MRWACGWATSLSSSASTNATHAMCQYHTLEAGVVLNRLALLLLSPSPCQGWEVPGKNPRGAPGATPGPTRGKMGVGKTGKTGKSA